MPQETLEKDEKAQESKDCENCKAKNEYYDITYKKLLELNDVSHEKMADTIKLDAKENNDPLSRFLVNLVETTSIEDKKTLWDVVCKTLFAHFSLEEIQSKVDEANIAIEALNAVNSNNCVVVEATNDKKKAILTFSLKLLEDKNIDKENDEEIIKFAKEHAPNSIFKDEKSELRVLRGEEITKTMQESKKMLLEQLREENGECQENKSQQNQQ